MTSGFLALVAVARLALPCLAADAQTDAASPCREDVKRYCADARSDEQRAECLESQPNVSQACLESLAPTSAPRKGKGKGLGREALGVCGPDYVRLCKPHDVPLRCLMAHKMELSPKCVGYMKKRRKALRSAGPEAE